MTEHRRTDLQQLGLDFDPESADFQRDPYPTLSALREATPIFHDPRSGQWMITRFDDVRSLLRNPRLGRVFHHRYTDAEWGRPERDRRWTAFDEHDRWTLLSREPPDHTRLRRMVSKVFTPSAVASRNASIEASAKALAEQCHRAGEFDLLADFAQPFSVGVIADVLGFPHADGPSLLDWSHRIVRMYELSADDRVKADADQAAAEFIEYVEDQIATKQASPDDCLLSALVHVEDDGTRLTTPEIVSTAMSLIEAGHEATVNTLGNGMKALLEQRSQWARIVGGEVEARVAVEELLRYDAPLQLFSRWVLDDGVEIAGQNLEVGQQVGLLFGSAQRDPRRFDHPDRFDVGRNDPSHIGFGAGIHFCVGAPLARQELSVALAALVRTVPTLELAAEPRYQQAFVMRGLVELCVVAEAAASAR